MAQMVPTHRFPHNYVVINDNTAYSNAVASANEAGNTRVICVFASPKGEDGKVKTIRNGLAGFIKEYGDGPFTLYGQPLLNAKAAAASGATTLHCLRVAATNAINANVTLVAKFKGDSETNAVTVKFEAVTTAGGVDLDNLDAAYTNPNQIDTEGYTTVKIFTLAYKGKGAWGNNLGFRIINDTVDDKVNNYKNYQFGVFNAESGVAVTEENYSVVFLDDAVNNGVSLSVESLVNDPEDGSDMVVLEFFEDGVRSLYNAYKQAVAAISPTTKPVPFEEFDFLFGMIKNTSTLLSTYYTVDTASTGTVDVRNGVMMSSGNDGSFSVDTAASTRTTAMNAQYLAAFGGEIDPMIKSKNKFPTDIIFDANFPVNVKHAVAALATTRGDCMAILDCGTNISKSTVLDYCSENFGSYVKNRLQMVDAYAGKARDSYSGKIVPVTSTFALSSLYPAHFQAYGNKSIPLAGNNYGEIEGFIANSIYPVFDEDIDADTMDELVDENINFARLNSNEQIVRATQETRQDMNSVLSDANNVFILLDIKRDCEKLCETYQYNFSEASDIARFNEAAANLLAGYGETQVRSITANFSKNAWEAERGYIELQVDIVDRDLVKVALIALNLNRS